MGNQIGEYRAQLLAIDGTTVTVLGEVTGDSTLPNDMSYTDSLVVVPTSNEGERVAVRLGIDPARANWQNLPIWDNLALSYSPKPPAGTVIVIK